jgi:hypothetical protein
MDTSLAGKSFNILRDNSFLSFFDKTLFSAAFFSTLLIAKQSRSES